MKIQFILTADKDDNSVSFYVDTFPSVPRNGEYVWFDNIAIIDMLSEEQKKFIDSAIWIVNSVSWKADHTGVFAEIECFEDN